MELSTALELTEKYYPERLEKIATYLDAIEKTSPFILEDTLNEFSVIGGTLMEKTSSLTDKALGVGAAVGSAALLGIVGSVSTDLYDAAKRGLTSSGNFKNIMKNNPQLHEFDSAQLSKSFSTLHKFAPDFTSDPNLGGSILHSMVSNPENQLVIMKDLINTRKSLSDIKSKNFQLPRINIPQIETPDTDSEAADVARKFHNKAPNIVYRKKTK